MSDVALILAGHGSHVSPNTAGIVWQYVDRLRSWAVADEITACFWKESPSFRQVFDTVTAKDIVIVPVFTAGGYFTRDVIPSEMGLAGKKTVRDGRTIRLTPSIGEHPLMEDIVHNLLRETIDRHNLPGEDTAVAIIGHGTRRNANSRDATRHQAARLRERGLVSEVADVYLDDLPDIPSIYRHTSAKNIIALPYFLAPGSHVSIDVPRALGIFGDDGPQLVQGRNVYYTDPIGTDERICPVILELARETGLPFGEKAKSAPWTAFPRSGRDTLVQALEEHQTIQFGQLRVSRKRVWCSDESQIGLTINSPSLLRALTREEPFRPLPTRVDLLGGWQVELENPQHAHAVLETVYPGLVADWASQRNGRFKSESLQALSDRQQGVFKGVHEMAHSVIDNTTEKICGNCIRQPSWQKNGINGELPCKEACNYWLTSAIELGKNVV